MPTYVQRSAACAAHVGASNFAKVRNVILVAGL